MTADIAIGMYARPVLIRCRFGPVDVDVWVICLGVVVRTDVAACRWNRLRLPVGVAAPA
jgi:hypothetical protein